MHLLDEAWKRLSHRSKCYDFGASIGLRLVWQTLKPLSSCICKMNSIWFWHNSVVTLGGKQYRGSYGNSCRVLIGGSHWGLRLIRSLYLQCTHSPRDLRRHFSIAQACSSRLRSRFGAVHIFKTDDPNLTFRDLLGTRSY